jgi:hypothetical protein
MRIGGAWLALGSGAALLLFLLYHFVLRIPIITEGEFPMGTHRASQGEVTQLLVLSVLMVVLGTVLLVFARRAEVVVEPLGIAVYGFGVNPTFACGWNQITSVEYSSGEGGSYVRLRAGGSDVDLPTNIKDWDDLCRYIEFHVPPSVSRIRLDE